MKFRDMLRMSSSNLWKRKVRTFLTVLGVVIGTASIVVMISIGLGLSRASLAEIEQYGGITTVTVTEQGSGYGIMEDDEQTLGQAYGSGHLDDDLIEKIKEIDHVKDVYPLLETDVLAFCGKYQTNIELRGIPADKADLLGDVLTAFVTKMCTGVFVTKMWYNVLVLEVIWRNFQHRETFGRFRFMLLGRRSDGGFANENGIDT